MDKVLSYLIYLILLLGVILGYAKVVESRVIFYPMKTIEFSPQLLGLAFEDIYITTEDGLKLNGWFIPAENSRATVLFLHGNAGNIGHRLEKLLILHNLRLNILIIDYRGYGRSQGRPSEKGIYLDAQAGYVYLSKERKINPQQLIVYGESIGTAAAIDLAAKEKIGALIVESGFSRGRDVAKVVYPYLPAIFFSNNFNSLSKIKKVSCPKLFLHSKNDEIVPFALSQRLYQAAEGPKYFAELIGGHNTAFMESQEKYIFSLRTFIDGLFDPK